jgi:hypothetical protein
MSRMLPAALRAVLPGWQRGWVLLAAIASSARLTRASGMTASRAGQLAIQLNAYAGLTIQRVCLSRCSLALTHKVL